MLKSYDCWRNDVKIVYDKMSQIYERCNFIRCKANGLNEMFAYYRDTILPAIRLAGNFVNPEDNIDRHKIIAGYY